jgi:2,4-dienoyl-CoA reductase-like NADH-dependent reductase (Old Yellow Enzyme family)
MQQEILNMTSLFDPLQAGALNLKNRCVMAPLTRARAGESRLPNALMAEYYAQRAGAGLIISEATAISPEGYGWKDAPGAYTPDMEKGWKAVTDAVHAKGGLMVLQLWHMGRISHPDLLGGQLPVAPSAIAASGVNRSLGTDKTYVVPRPMTKDDIRRTVDDYVKATKLALRVGFDGVEIHGANGYLIDQFLKDGANKRDDEYGGSVENRARFLLEVVDAVTSIAGKDRTGLRLSPDNVQDCADSDPVGTFTRVAELLNPKGLAYLHIKEPSRDKGGQPVTPAATKSMRGVYKGMLIANEGYDGKTGQGALDSGLADAIAFGVPFLANPDFVERLKTGAPLNPPDQKHFYQGGAVGYTDYPTLKSQAA